MSFPYEFETTVLQGLPVLIRYAVLGADRPATRDCPAEHEEVEYEVCDRRGRYAPWIVNRMTPADHQTLLDDLHDERTSAMDSIAEDWQFERRYI